MKITLTKKQNRNRIICTRPDGSYCKADLGPNLPYHDLAHYVGDRALQLREGFFGKIARGYTFEQLATKDVILSLGAESWVSEVVARALGSVSTGACALAELPALVGAELVNMSIHRPNLVSVETAASMFAEYRQLLDRFAALGDGESLQLEIDGY